MKNLFYLSLSIVLIISSGIIVIPAYADANSATGNVSSIRHTSTRIPVTCALPDVLSKDGKTCVTPSMVYPYRSKITLTSNANPSAYGRQVTFTATVIPSSGSGTISGTVRFTIDGVTKLPVDLYAGHAVVSLSTLSVGIHSVTATYSGSSNFASSVGNTVTQIVYKVHR